MQSFFIGLYQHTTSNLRDLTFIPQIMLMRNYFLYYRSFRSYTWERIVFFALKNLLLQYKNPILDENITLQIGIRFTAPKIYCLWKLWETSRKCSIFLGAWFSWRKNQASNVLLIVRDQLSHGWHRNDLSQHKEEEILQEIQWSCIKLYLLILEEVINEHLKLLLRCHLLPLEPIK